MSSKSIFLLLAVVSIFLFGWASAADPIILAPDLLYTQYIKKDQTKLFQIPIHSQQQAQDASITVFPCDGNVDWWVSKDIIPTALNNDYHWFYPDTADHTNQQTKPVGNYSLGEKRFDGNYNLIIKGNFQPEAQVRIYASLVGNYPFPKAEGGVQAVDMGDKGVRIAWKPINSTTVQYCVYGHRANDTDRVSTAEQVIGSFCAAEHQVLLKCTKQNIIYVTVERPARWHFDVVVTDNSTTLKTAYVGTTIDVHPRGYVYVDSASTYGVAWSLVFVCLCVFSWIGLL